MAVKYHVLLVALTLHLYVSAAPSEDKKPEELIRVEQGNANLDSKSLSLLDETETEKVDQQNQREKRWYNYYGFPPINPSTYPGFGKRDELFNPAGFGSEDPFVEIHRRLQELSEAVKQPISPLPQFPQISSPNQFPFYLPVFYIPQVACDCTPQKDNVPTVPDNQKNNTSPDIDNRFTDMEDERQNWGVVNETGKTNPQEEDDDNDGARPISFDPIQPNMPMERPVPPVEHGSSQGNIEGSDIATDVPFQNPTTVNPTQSPSTRRPPEAPTACDGAVLTCCHQLQVTYDCFAVQGCPDPTAYGNPCDSNVILRVIDRFQRFYGQTTG